MKIKTYYNSTFEEEAALVNVENDEVILHGDYYHDKIIEQIDGFIYALNYLKIEHEILEPESIAPDNKLFEKIGFYEEDSSFEDYDDEVENGSDEFEEKTEGEEEPLDLEEEQKCEDFCFYIEYHTGYDLEEVNYYGSFVSGVNKAIDFSGDLYYLDDKNEASLIYFHLGLEREDNNKMLSSFKVYVNDDEEATELE